MAFLAVIGVLTFAVCWHLVLEEIDWRIRSARMWREIKKRIQ
jgi:hypothetical protein